MFKANDLYDMQLILEGLTNEEIVSNDILIEKDTEGLLFRGPNTSGKTSLLRAIGAAQIFAQAGLPVCASAARMSIRNAVFNCFLFRKEFNAACSAVWGEFRNGKNTYRSCPHSMILLNVTSRRTPPEARRVSHILNFAECLAKLYLSQGSCSFSTGSIPLR
jgi:hypothetical protein